MSWANLDDQFPTHPKVVRLTDAAFRLHVSAICYCANHMTDGLIDADAVRLLVPRFKPSAVTELVERGVWLQHGDVYELHDYLQWNRSKQTILEERERKHQQRSAAGKRGAAARWGRDTT